MEVQLSLLNLYTVDAFADTIEVTLSMEKDFLLKEEEFHKLNAELEARTQELLKEVEDVMKIQDRITKTKNHTTSNPKGSSGSSELILTFHSSDNLEDIVTVSLNDTKCMLSNNSRCTSRTSVKYGRRGSAKSLRSELPHLTPNRGAMSLDVLHVPEEPENKLLPESSFAMGTEGTIRFLKAKLKSLQNEMGGLQTDYKKRTEEWRKVQAEMKQVEEDRNKCLQQAGVLKETIKKLEMQNSCSSSKLAQKEIENANIRKELETLKKELKTVLHSSSANEVRLNRSLEELDKVRGELQNYKRNDKELRDITRRKGEEVAATTHLKAACLIQFSEAEFMKLIEWCPAIRPIPKNPQ
ncbi:hypothetical protein C0J52_10616 [Blattella germanica]|nr:hypothetical protein C0J52_10616 [Blattella germanica]